MNSEFTELMGAVLQEISTSHEVWFRAFPMSTDFRPVLKAKLQEIRMEVDSKLSVESVELKKIL